MVGLCTEYRAGSWWHSFQWLHNTGSICMWTQSHLGLICQRYTSNSNVTQITLFSSTLALSKSILSDVAEPFGLSVLRDANYMWREKIERRREARTEKNEMLMWKYNETDERETGGNKGRHEERHYSNDLRGFCLHGCDVTHQQSMFWSERLTHTWRAYFTKKINKSHLLLCSWSCEVRSWIYCSGTHTCTNTHMLVSVLDFLLQ